MFRYVDVYKDFNGTERKETVYFDLNQSEIIGLEIDSEKGLSEYLQEISDAKNAKEMMRFFTNTLYKAYGEKSADGRRFVKSKELSDAFTQTVIYQDIYAELLTNAEFASKFINSIMPDMGALADKINKNADKNKMMMEKIQSDKTLV